MTTTPRQPVYTTVLPAALVALDIEVREDFLSDDMETICTAAAKTQSTVLISNAGHSRKQRDAAFAIWRKAGLVRLAEVCPAVYDFLSRHAALAAEFEAGTIDLLHLDRLMSDAKEDAGRERLDLLAIQKEALRTALSSNCVDMPPGGWPGVLVVRGDGQMALHKNPLKAKAWGAIGNQGFYLFPLSAPDVRRFLPA